MTDGKQMYEQALKYYVLKVEMFDINAAIKAFKEALKLGFGDAAYFLGRFYQTGVGVDLNEQRAYTYYEEGVQKGSHKALVGQAGMVIKTDEAKGRALYEQAYNYILAEATYNDPISQYLLGCYFYYGYLEKATVFESIRWYKQASDDGNSDASYMLGLIYETIDVKNPQMQTAFNYYQMAATMGHPYAVYRLAVEAIENRRFDDAKAKLQSLAAFYPAANYALGKVYQQLKRPKRALEAFIKGSAAGHLDSMVELGLAYQMGAGVEAESRNRAKMV